MEKDNVVPLTTNDDSLGRAWADIEGEFNLELDRAMAMADLLSLCERVEELKAGTVNTTGNEILASLVRVRKKFEQLLQLHVQSSDENPDAQTASV